MARSINFQYKYPYDVWNEYSKFRMDYDASRVTLSGNYTYPLSFKTTFPYITKARISISASNVSGTSILNRSWYLYLYNGSWRSLVTFTMPATGEYVWEGTVGYSSCQKFAAVPTSTLSSSTEWSLGISIEGLWVQETLTTTDFSTTDYIANFFINQSGITQRPNGVSVNIDGTIVKATKVLVNVDGNLIELPPAYSGAYTTTASDSMRVYEFTPSSTGDYKFEVVLKSGDHEARMFNSSFVQIHPNGTSGYTEGQYFYSGTFTLTGGSLYYISLIHYPYSTTAGDSVLFITK